MPKLSKYPGVSIVKRGVVHWLMFNHPKVGKRLMRSVQTTDAAIAEDYAKKLSVLLRSPANWNKKPEGFPDPLWTMWDGGSTADQLLRDVVSEKLAAYRIDFNGMSLEELLANFEQLQATEKHKGKILDLSAIIAGKFKGMADEIAKLRAEKDELRAMFRRWGKEVAEDYTPKPIRDAVTDYCSTDINKRGTNACDGTLQSVKSKLMRFADSLPPDIMAGDVSAKQVIEYLAAVKSGKYRRKYDTGNPGREHIRLVGVYICAMLEHQTGGMFKDVAVKDWLKKHNSPNAKDDEPEYPYWIDQADVDRLCEHLPEYWKAAALIQWSGAFRPTELPALQSDKATIGPETRIEIARILDGKRVVWSAKTKQSYGKVHQLKAAEPTIKKLKARGRFLLFPNDSTLHGGRTPHYKRDEFAKKHQLWSGKYFCEQYLPQLIVAAKKAGLDVERFDSRTLRRSAGKRVLLLTGYDINRTAAFLRDQPKTVLKHYASIIPDDVRQPEVKYPALETAST